MSRFSFPPGSNLSPFKYPMQKNKIKEKMSYINYTEIKAETQTTKKLFKSKHKTVDREN